MNVQLKGCPNVEPYVRKRIVIIGRTNHDISLEFPTYNPPSTTFSKKQGRLSVEILLKNHNGTPVGGDILGCIYHGITDSVIMVLPWFSR